MYLKEPKAWSWALRDHLAAQPMSPFLSTASTFNYEHHSFYCHLVLEINKQKFAPLTILRVGVGSQENIGLDKQSLNGSIQYQWNSRENRRWTFSLIDVEFVNNKNKANYFGVYNNAYGELNQIAANTNTNPNYLVNDRLIIPQGTASFIEDVLGGSTGILASDPSYQRVQRIEERRSRLTQNNLIISSGINFFSSSKQSIFDREFMQFRANLSWSGNLLKGLAKSFNWKQENGQYLLFEVPFSPIHKIGNRFCQALVCER
jgi:hypothetical protein